MSNPSTIQDHFIMSWKWNHIWDSYGSEYSDNILWTETPCRLVGIPLFSVSAWLVLPP